MATLTGLNLSDAYWYSANWNQFLAAVLNGGGASSDNLDLKGFRYKNANEDATTQPYVDVSVSNFSSRFGNVASRSFHFILNDLQVPSNAVETVLYMSGTNWSTSNVMTIDDRYGLGFLYLWNAPTMHFNVLYRTDDNTIHEYCFRDGVEYTNSAPVLYYIPGEQNSLTYGLGDDGDPTHYVPKDSNGYSWAIPGEPTKSIKTSFKCSHKSFLSRDDAYNYLKYGIDNSLNEEDEGGGDEEVETESEQYFYDCYNEYYSDLALTNHIASTTQKYKITFEDFPKGTTPVYAKVNNEKYINNVQFMVHDGYGEYITSASSKIGNIEVPITENILSTFMGIRTNYGIIYDSTNDRYCKTTVYTNMPIIGVDGNAVPGRLPDSDDMISAENGADYDCGLSECWLLDTENVQKLASIFNTTINKNGDNAVTGVVAEWVQGLSCYSNPLDVVCDLFYMPINVDDFVTGTNRSFKLQQDFFDD